MPDRCLTPRLHHRLAALIRGPSWRRAAWARRAVAGVLATTALVLALAPPAAAARSPVVVVTADLAGGVTMRPSDVAVRQWPTALVPAGVLSDPVAAAGRMLVGAARAGELLTDRRLVDTRAGPGAGSSAVPLRLDDAAVAALLVPGDHVDVVTAGDRLGGSTVLAQDATVLAVLAEDARAKGRLVLVALPRDAATHVAAAALSEEVAVTLR